MALQFNDLLAQPFHDNIKKELENRRTLSQRYETSPTLHNPYFRLNRLDSLSKDGELGVANKVRELKYWDLTKYSKEGLDKIINKENTNYRAPVGITDVSIEIKDYTFHEVTIEFLVPDIQDWDAFKNTWLVFGAPVQYEFGRESYVEIDEDADIRPDKEIREGLVANFSWQTGENQRTVTGSMTIYSSTFIELSSKAHSKSKDSDMITAHVIKKLKEEYDKPKDIKRDKLLEFYGSRGERYNTNTPYLRDEIQKEFFKRTENFYSVISKGTYVERRDLVETKRGSDGRIGGNDSVGSVVTLDTSYTSPVYDKFVPFGVEIISGDLKELISDIEAVNFNLDRPKPHESLSEEQINFIQGGAPFQLNNGEDASSFSQWKRSRDIPDYVTIEELGVPRSNRKHFNEYGEKYLRWFRDNYSTKRMFDSDSNFLSSTTLQKFTLTQLNLQNDPNALFEDEVYFYVSMKFIQDIVNEYLVEKRGVEREALIAKYIFEDVKIRDLSFLGLGSAQPDRVLINPWDKRYSRNDKDVDPNKLPDNTIVNDRTYTAKNRYYKFDPQGDVTLMENIFISAPTLVEIAEVSESTLEFVENIINTIEGATDNLLKFQKIGDEKVFKSKHYNKGIRFFEISTMSEASEGKNYHTFDLFDPREKLRNIDVQSSLDDDFAEYAYFKSLGNFYGDESLFLMDDVLYNDDGTVNEEKTSQYYENANFWRYSLNDNRKFVTSAENRNDINIEGEREFIEGQKVVQSYEQLYNGAIENVRSRLTKYYTDGEIVNDDELISLNLLGYIQAYFTTLARTYQMIYDPALKTNGTTTIPLKVDISIDGIAGIVTGNAFKISLESFPMAYNIDNTSPLFVVSTLSHNITSQNDWETTIGGFLFIAQGSQFDAVLKSSRLKDLIDSKNGRLKALLLQLETAINEIIS